MASWFGGVETAPPIEVFALTAAFNEDTHEKKVNLGVGGGLWLIINYINFFFYVMGYKLINCMPQ